MHNTHIFDQKNYAKKTFLPTYLPYFFWTVTENKQLFFLGLIDKLCIHTETTITGGTSYLQLMQCDLEYGSQ